jgi:hypothetical protein
VWLIQENRRPNIPVNVTFAIVCFHHFATAFGPRLSLPGGIDLALTLTEVIITIYGLNNVISRQSSRIYALAGAMAYITGISLFLLLVMRIAEALKMGWSFLLTQYDIAGPEWRHVWSKSSTDDLEGGLADKRRREGDKTLSTSDVLFGRSIWKEHFRGERRWLIVSRGIIAALAIVMVALYTVFLVVVEPVRETALTPVRDSRTLGFPNDFPSKGNIWNVVVGKPIDKDASAVDISPAVKVVYLNDDVASTTDCPRAQNGALGNRLYAIYDKVALNIATFQCPPSLEDRGAYPDILVTVNFTLLTIATNTTGKTRWNSVQVLLGRTDDTIDVARRTAATTLIPGMNLVGIADRQIRQVSTNPSAAALGVFDSIRSFVSSELVQVWPDPRTSSLIPRGPDISTIRIVTPFSFAEWKIVEQTREKSVLQGLAGAGGIWTFIGGIFTALFGSSIIRIIFGTKLISLFGVAHAFAGNEIGNAYRTEYPRLESDLKVNPAGKGIVAFLSDHLLDLKFLERPAGQQPVDDPSTPSTSEKRLEANVIKDKNPDTTPLLPMSAVSSTFSPPSSPPFSDTEYNVLTVPQSPGMTGPWTPPPMSSISQSLPENQGTQST